MNKAAEDLFGPVTTGTYIGMFDELATLRAENERLRAEVKDARNERNIAMRWMQAIEEIDAGLSAAIGQPVPIPESSPEFNLAQWQKNLATLAAERDAARAEVERLRAELTDYKELWSRANERLTQEVVLLRDVVFAATRENWDDFDDAVDRLNEWKNR